MNRPTRGILYGGAAIADHLGVKRRLVYAMAAKGRLPTFRVGCVVCATPETLDEWRARREAEARRSSR